MKIVATSKFSCRRMKRGGSDISKKLSFKKNWFFNKIYIYLSLFFAHRCQAKTINKLKIARKLLLYLKNGGNFSYILKTAENSCYFSKLAGKFVAYLQMAGKFEIYSQHKKKMLKINLSYLSKYLNINWFLSFTYFFLSLFEF